MELSGAQTFVYGFEKMGVRHLYGIIGTSILGFFEGLYTRQNHIRYISCRHEQVAATMAEVEGRLTGNPGIALVHSGPGALNAMISVGNAYKDCAPMILITGAVKSRLQGTDGMLEADHGKLFSSFIKAFYRVHRVDDIPEILSKAYHASLDGAYGPVLIEVPENIWKEKTQILEDSFSFIIPSKITPDPESMRQVHKAYACAKRPLAIVGSGIASAKAETLLCKWVEQLNIPVVTTGNGRGVLPENHPLNLGRVGFGGGTTTADQAFCQCDVLVGIGCGISDMVTYEYTQSTSADIYLINLDPKSNSKPAYVEKLILADAGLALEQLIKLNDEKKTPTLPQWIESLHETKAQWQASLAQCANLSNETLSPSQVLASIARKMPSDTITCVGAGMHAQYANDYLPSLGSRQFLAAVNFGAMGFGMAAAMASKLVFPERTVLAVLGDGEFLMAMQDLETLVREKIGVKICILNDNAYRVLEYKQKLNYQGHVIGTKHTNPDFVLLAQAFGLPCIQIKEVADIEKGVQDFISSKGPVLMEIQCNPDDLPPTNLEAVLKMGQG